MSARGRRATWFATAAMLAAALGVGCSSGSAPRLPFLSRQATVTEARRAPLADGVRHGSFLGDGSRRSYGQAPAPKELRLVWKYRIGSGQTSRKDDGRPATWAGSGWTGQPTLVQDAGRPYLLIGGYDHSLHKVDAITGDGVWEYAFDDVIKGTNTVFRNPAPSAWDDRYIVVAGSRRGFPLSIEDERIAPVRAVAFGSGRELWRLPVPRTECYSRDADSSSLWYRGRLYVAVESGYVYSVDPDRTKPWRGHRTPVVLARSPRLFTDADLQRHYDPVDYGENVVLESSLVLLGKRLYAASGSGHVYGLDPDDLSVRWDYAVGSDIDGTPAVTRDARLLVAVEQQYIPGRGGVLALDPSREPSSSVDWFFPTRDSGFGEWEGGVIGSVAVSDAGDKPALAAFCSVDGDLYVIAPEDLADARVKGPNGEEGLRTPKLVHRASVGASISTPLIIGDSIVACGYDRKVHLYQVRWSRDGDGVALKARDGSVWRAAVRETDSFTLGGPIESTPLVWKGRLFIGCRDGYLYCLGDAPASWGTEAIEAYLD